MEVQFIKVNPTVRPVFDEEVGRVPFELTGVLPVAVGARGDADGPPSWERLHSPLAAKSSLTTLNWSLAKEHGDLDAAKTLARSLDIELTLHAPYYVDFFGSEEARTRSLRQLEWACVIAESLGARLVVTHLGFYGPGSRADSTAELASTLGNVARWLRQYSRGSLRLGIEPSGHPDVFGSREEVLELARRARLVPVLNVPHLAARERRPFDTVAEIRPIVDEFVAASAGPLYAHFSGVEMNGPNEFRLTPIKRGAIRFDPLADVLAEREYDVTVISSSPLLEHDAMYMKLLYERALARRWARLHPTPPPSGRPGARATVPTARPKAPALRKQPRPPRARPHAPARRPARLPRRTGQPRPTRRSPPSRRDRSARRESHGAKRR